MYQPYSDSNNAWLKIYFELIDLRKRRFDDFSEFERRLSSIICDGIPIDQKEDSLPGIADLIRAHEYYSFGYKEECLNLIADQKLGIDDFKVGYVASLAFTRLRIQCLMDLERHGDAIIECEVARRSGVPLHLLPISTLIGRNPRELALPSNARGHIILLRKHLGVSAQEINSALEAYLTSRSILLPSELCGDEIADLEISILADCCTADVLEWNINIQTPSQVATERLAICNHLLNAINGLSAESRTQLNVEVNNYTEYLFRCQAVKQLATTRIYVPIDTLRKILRRELKDALASIMLFKQSGVDIISISDLLKKIDATGGADEVKRTSAQTWCLSIYKEIFKKTLDRFCWDRHFGLDGHLSMTIRHGTLHGQIRSAFQRFDLVTERLPGEMDYEDNVTLADEVRISGPERTELYIACEKLSRSIDSYHDIVRGEMIQIQTDESHAQGLFKLKFSEEEVEQIWFERILDCNNEDEIVEETLASISERLRICLSLIQEFFTLDATEVLLGMIKDFENECRQLNVSEPLRQVLAAKINTCKTAVQSQMLEAATWFSAERADRIPSFSLQLLVNFAFTQIERLQAKTIGGKSVSIDREIFIDGAHFSAIYHLFQILLSNAVIHSGQAVQDTNIAVSVRDDDLTPILFSVIEVRNSIAPSINLSERRERIDEHILQAQEAPGLERIGLEERSGLPKIFRILKTTFDTKSTVFCTERDGDIVVAVRCNLRSLAAK